LSGKGAPKIERREFFRRVFGSTALLLAPGLLASFIESCSSLNNPTGSQSSGSSLSKISGTYQSGIVNIDVGSSSPLASAGGVALVSYSGGNLLVDRPTTDTFNALSAICTHQGCLIDSYDSSNKQFVCTCHGSHFSLTGAVEQGPASRALPTYQTSFANSKLTVQL
jgi:cytochrome b6-f complex iron-sulfur subunit